MPARLKLASGSPFITPTYKADNRIVLPGLEPPSPEEVASERAANFDSILRFGFNVLPRWFTAPPSRFHKYLDRKLRKMACGPGESHHVVLAPRGNAKSTVVSKATTLWLICHQKEILEANGGIPLDCIVLISYSLSLPTSFVIDIRRELMNNDHVRKYYPEAFGEGDEKWTESLIRTNNGVWVAVGSTGRDIRGILPENKRPRWIVLDDTDSAKHVNTLVQRDKAWSWLFADVVPTGESPERKADIIAVGTRAHRDSLLSRLEEVWLASRPFKAVIRDSKNQHLWEHWRDLYLDVEGELGDARACAINLWHDTGKRLLDAIDAGEDPNEADEYLHQWWVDAWIESVGDAPAEERDMRDAYQAALLFCDDYRDALPDEIDEILDEWEGALLETIREITGRHSKALAYFHEHEDDMMEGVRVLWPEAQPYYHLMRMKAEHPIAFAQEMQNEIRRAEEELFPREAWTLYEAPTHPSPEMMRRQFPDGSLFIGALDPSMGKQSKKHDFAAVVILGKPPGGKWRIAWCWIRREKPSIIFLRMLELNRIFKCRSWVVETNQFQELFADLMIEDSESIGEPLRIHKVTHTANDPKELRIRGLEPHVVNGRLEFPGRKAPDGNLVPMTTGYFRLLWEQFEWYGETDIHDDGPDACEMAWTEAMRITRFGKIKIETTTVNRTGRSSTTVEEGRKNIELQEKDEAERRKAMEEEVKRRKKETAGEDTLQKIQRLGLFGKRKY